MHELLEKGYYFGNITEIVKDLPKFNNLSDNLIELSIDKSKYYTYRHNINKQYNAKNSIEIWEIPERKKFVEDNNLDVFQQWYESNKDPNGDLKNIHDFFRGITVDAVSNIYSNLNSKNVQHVDNFTIYENGDYINVHNDGNNPGRVCVILIYLSDPNSYNDGGGKLRIHNPTTLQSIDEVIPVRGNYALIDFTKHNISHSVEMVKNDFSRFCYINFVYKVNVNK